MTGPALGCGSTEGDSFEEALENVKDALSAVVEAYQELGQSLSQNAKVLDENSPVWMETVITAHDLS